MTTITVHVHVLRFLRYVREASRVVDPESTATELEVAIRSINVPPILVTAINVRGSLKLYS